MALLHTAQLTCRADALTAFKQRLLRHAQITVSNEPGCQRFEVSQSRDDATVFLLYEVYTDQAALDAHRAARHYLQFRSDTAAWVTDRKWWFWDPLPAAP